MQPAYRFNSTSTELPARFATSAGGTPAFSQVLQLGALVVPRYPYGWADGEREGQGVGSVWKGAVR